MAILNLEDAGCAFVGVNEAGKLEFYINEDFVNGDSHFGTGYVHTVESEHFIATKNDKEFTSDKNVRISDVREFVVNDLEGYVKIRATTLWTN